MRLLDLCRTRWIYRHEALENFGQFYEVLVDLLEEIKGSSHSTWNRDTVTDATALLVSITNFEFLMAFYVLWKSLTLIKGLSISLQSSSIDICRAYKDVTTTKTSVQHISDNVDDFHSQWFHLAKSRAEAVGVGAPSIPRCCGRQKNRNNTPAEDPKEYFKRAITIPFLDHLLTQLDVRFSSDQQRVMQGLSLVPTVMMETSQWSEHIIELAELYHNDLPSTENLDMELLYWKTKWNNHEGDLPKDPKSTLMQCDKNYFPNIFTLLRIVCTLPVTSCSCERSISGLKRFKTYLRSTMGGERLNGLALMHFNYGMELDYDAIICAFARKHPRRMSLLNVLES